MSDHFVSCRHAVAGARLISIQRPTTLSRMSERISAGLLIYRRQATALEVFLAHPGGPYHVHKDRGHWSIPKGEIEPGEDLLATAIREFKEETGLDVDPAAAFSALGSIRQKGGKIVHAWAVEMDFEDTPIVSNCFSMEWPPGSGRMQDFPEIDHAQFFPILEARIKIKATQIPLIDRLEAQVAGLSG
jgi:predicted NUDIX family NTP pyrophosphohydrolase